MKIKLYHAFMAGICALSFCAVSCESDSNDGPKFTMEDIAGEWRGELGRTDTRAVLTLAQNGNKLSGTVVINNAETFSVNGSRAGNVVTLTVKNGDKWNLVLKDPDDLDGFATAKNGTRYEVDFDR